MGANSCEEEKAVPNLLAKENNSLAKAKLSKPRAVPCHKSLKGHSQLRFKKKKISSEALQFLLPLNTLAGS